jgi:alanine racemase
MDMMINNQLEPEIYHFGILDKWKGKLAGKGIKNYPIHLKLDTGMHRLGFQNGEINQLINTLKHQENLMVKSIFSHLSASDEKKHDTFTKNQFEKFNFHADKIINNLGYPVMKHILNSSGIQRFTEQQHDMVRLGIGLHGISPLPNSNLREVSTLKSRILQIKEIEAGEPIGYRLSEMVNKKSKIAVISIGYADGLRRSFGNGKLKVLVNGKFAPLVGNVCMDMSMINISGIDAREGDEVIIFGEKNPVRTLADVANTNVYEILTMVSARVPRIYIQE